SIMPCEGGYEVTPIAKVPESAILNVRESGSTLRFLLSVVGALGVETTFLLSGRLGSRPLSPLWEEISVAA
ncbi:MAG: 3-phosphoshikimate 1-carboxyvinyltransferase, partial [Clostridia bacterium]|nr:3-phosphoshikimate 1-carboxyvinyltransferase [Clostridia bacterium]